LQPVVRAYRDRAELRGQCIVQKESAAADKRGTGVEVGSAQCNRRGPCRIVHRNAAGGGLDRAVYHDAAAAGSKGAPERKRGAGGDGKGRGNGQDATVVDEKTRVGPGGHTRDHAADCETVIACAVQKNPCVGNAVEGRSAGDEKAERAADGSGDAAGRTGVPNTLCRRGRSQSWLVRVSRRGVENSTHRG